VFDVSENICFNVGIVCSIAASVARIAGSDPVKGMDVYLLCLYVVLSCVGGGHCDGLITRPEESYWRSLYVCD
jgi:hypothetical protein